MVGRKGLEPLRIMPLILSQSCLPVPASAHMNNKRGLQLIRICLLPPTPQSIGGHLTGSVARRSTFFIFRIPLMVRVAGLEPARAKTQQIFFTTPCRHGRARRCSPDYVFSISYDLGGWYIVSTHLFSAILTTIRVSKSMAIWT